MVIDTYVNVHSMCHARCEVMVKFIDKLRGVETPELANRILENFSVLQVGIIGSLAHVVLWDA